MRPLLEAVQKILEMLLIFAAGTLMLSIPGVILRDVIAPEDVQTAALEDVSRMMPEEVTETETHPQPTTEAPTEPPTEPPELPTADSRSLILDIPYYSQHELNMPTGCELVSARMMLEFYCNEIIGMEEIIGKTKRVRPEMIDGEVCAPHPAQAFVGEPFDATCFGCFSPVIVDMMNQILPEDFEAVDTTGMGVSELVEKYIKNGQPVLLWATIDMQGSFPNVGWYLRNEDGTRSEDWYDWLANEHCLVLVGYDETNYYFNDPNSWHAATAFKKEIVEQRNAEIGGYSVAVAVKEPEPEKQKETRPAH